LIKNLIIKSFPINPEQGQESDKVALQNELTNQHRELEMKQDEIEKEKKRKELLDKELKVTQSTFNQANSIGI
jgi:hypothetical protein